MNALILPKNFAAILAALALAALMSAAPRHGAFAADAETVQTGTIESIIYVEAEEELPRDPAELRRLLSSPELSMTERRRLERVLADTYEEMA